MFGALTRLTVGQRAEMVEPYLAGVGLVAKSDMYLNMAVNACERFSVALLAVLRLFRGWDGQDATLPASIAHALPRMPADGQQELLDLLNRFRQLPPRFNDLTIERAAVLKALTDASLILVMEDQARIEDCGTKGSTEQSEGSLPR